MLLPAEICWEAAWSPSCCFSLGLTVETKGRDVLQTPTTAVNETATTNYRKVICCHGQELLVFSGSGASRTSEVTEIYHTHRTQLWWGDSCDREIIIPLRDVSCLWLAFLNRFYVDLHLRTFAMLIEIAGDLNKLNPSGELSWNHSLTYHAFLPQKMFWALLCA